MHIFEIQAGFSLLAAVFIPTYKKRPETYFISLGFRCPCQGVDATGFEPATSASRTQRSTKLSHASFQLA